MIYPGNFEHKIGFDRIRDLIKGYCLFERGMLFVDDMQFISHASSIIETLKLVSEFQNILESDESFPSDHYRDMIPVFKKLRVEGAIIEKPELFELKQSLETIKLILQFFGKGASESYPALRELARKVVVYPFVLEQINRIMTGKGKIKDNASQDLLKIRRSLKQHISMVSARMQSILKRARTEGYVDEDTELSMRNGRMVIPVRSSDKRKIQGLVHDESASGKTSFIEPSAIVELNNQIKELENVERREVMRILGAFTEAIRPYLDEMIRTYQFLGHIDFIRAKARFANAIGGLVPDMNDGPDMLWEKAIHPLLLMNFKRSGKEVVPLDITLDDEKRLLLISGPNAGGKSVCLQTVGLLQYMFQCGIPVPVGAPSKFGVFEKIFLDFGDEQSLDNDLSTYSSHLLNMKFFLKNAEEGTLILIDEFGSGTEPKLGGALAQAILGELDDLGVFGVVTTHYSNLKHFASSRESIINGAMLFDHQKMCPLYVLQIGKPGSSFAFEIARSIGLPEHILMTATSEVGEDHIYFDKHLREIARDKRYWENKRHRIRKAEKKLQETLETYEAELKAFEKNKKELLLQARSDAEDLLKSVNRKIEHTIKTIRETQAEKEQTRFARQALEKEKEKIMQSADSVEPIIKEKLEKLGREKKIRRVDNAAKGSDKQTESSGTSGLQAGDAVRMIGQDVFGEIMEVMEQTVMVAFGNMITTVPIDNIEKVSQSEYRDHTRLQTRISSVSSRITERKMHFKPALDIRGKRVDEAIPLIQDFIDEAIMVSTSKLSILHGKGNGILRQVVRDYLHTVDVVKTYHDEHPDRGGAGVTLVELDL